MKTIFFSAAVLVVVCMRVGWAAEARDQSNALSAKVDDDEEGRFLFGNGGLSLGGGTTGNTGTIVIGNAGYIALGAALLVPLIIGLALLFYLIGGPRDDSSYGYSDDSGYSSHARTLKE